MGVPHDIEALADDNFSLDIALRGRKVAIEVDGPSHFFANKPSEYMGADLLRGKILAVHGWKVRFFSSFGFSVFAVLNAVTTCFLNFAESCFAYRDNW